MPSAPCVWWTSRWTATPARSSLGAVSLLFVFFSPSELFRRTETLSWIVQKRGRATPAGKRKRVQNENLCHSNAVISASSDAYPISEIVYTWKKGPLSSVEVPQESSSLLQYDLIGQTVSSERLKSNTGEETIRSGRFHPETPSKISMRASCQDCQGSGASPDCSSAPAQVNMSSWPSTSTCRGKWASSLSRLTFPVSWQSFWLKSPSGLTKNLFLLGPSLVRFPSVLFADCTANANYYVDTAQLS